MLDKLKYISSTGKVIEFGYQGSNIILNTNEARDYEWTYNTKFKRITNFERQIKTFSLPLLIYGGSEKIIANQIFEIIEEDVLLGRYGQLYTDTGYYMKGFFNASAKPQYTANGFLNLELKFVSDKPYWIKEHRYEHRPNTDPQGGIGLDYAINPEDADPQVANYDYPYEYYMNANTISVIENNTISAQNARFIIYGFCSNPRLILGENTYAVNVDVEAGESLVIDTMDKTIEKHTARGTILNVFADRDPQWYIFAKVPQGENAFQISPQTNVDIIIMEERSEPSW